MAATELVVIEHSRVETGLLVFRLLGWSGINSSLGEAFFQLYFRIETHKRFSDEAGVQTVSIFFLEAPQDTVRDGISSSEARSGKTEL